MDLSGCDLKFLLVLAESREYLSKCVITALQSNTVFVQGLLLQCKIATNAACFCWGSLLSTIKVVIIASQWIDFYFFLCSQEESGFHFSAALASKTAFPLVFLKRRTFKRRWTKFAKQTGEMDNGVIGAQSGPCACRLVQWLCVLLCVLYIFVHAGLRERLCVSWRFAVAPSADWWLLDR